MEIQDFVTFYGKIRILRLTFHGKIQYFENSIENQNFETDFLWKIQDSETDFYGNSGF